MRKVINGLMIFIMGVITGSLGLSVYIAYLENERPGCVSKVYKSVL